MQLFTIFKIIFRLAFFLGTLIASAQDISGTWKGALKVQGMELPLAFNISETDGTLTTTLDSPKQNAFGLPTDETTFVENKLTIIQSQMGLEYTATYTDGTFKGTFKQAGQVFPLDLTKGEKVVKKVKPQDPKKPYPYASEEVTFENANANNIKFAGTLTLPKDVKNPPVVILITGSGPQNRNQELLGHKTFLVLSDHLTRQGIAVLRYDDRGTAKSEGDFSVATSFDFASDVEAAMAYLQTRSDVVDVNKIGLVGHSEGGLIAPIVAAKNKNVAFCVLLAGPGVDGKEILLTQGKRAAELEGYPVIDIANSQEVSAKVFDISANYKGEASKQKIVALFKELKAKLTFEKAKAEFTEQVMNQQAEMITSPWMRAFIKYDPQTSLQKVNCPVLAINGEKDFQVISDLNLNAIEKGLKHNKDVTIKQFKDLNHLFQTSETGALSEYAEIEETFAPIALNYVSAWINARF
ncbi:alpha/beta hydrolase [Kordia sp. YSTF-M3]|uniref:Alpha/beta hydrolase n=1 Tax=Kordia aestuariivivens TaxID=2759037 RepID=A0ABR7QAZ6_9FLAO|nr:alpha/beta hydrolase [Kordia aestuariivivens]MBC8755494.1 alpha/beta hydrolase [Kordia aestuariivivens]